MWVRWRSLVSQAEGELEELIQKLNFEMMESNTELEKHISELKNLKSQVCFLLCVWIKRL